MRLLRAPFHAIVALFLFHEFTALFFLLFLEEAGIPLPVPGDVLVAWAGSRHTHSLGYTLSVLMACSVGVFLGSSLLYTVMRRRGRPLLERYGRYVHLSERRLNRMERWFRRHGVLAILCGRMIPGLRMPTTVMAGLSDVPYRVYAPVCAVTAVTWAALYYYLGEMLQRPVRFIAARLLGEPDTLSDWIIVVTVLGLLASVATVWYLRRRARQHNAPSAAESGSTGPDAAPAPEPSGVA